MNDKDDVGVRNGTKKLLINNFSKRNYPGHSSNLSTVKSKQIKFISVTKNESYRSVVHYHTLTRKVYSFYC